jgi:processing peptidase subunit beta
VYFTKVFGGDLSRVVDILADILLNSRLNPRSILRERNVILREMKEVNWHKEELILDHLPMTAFDGLGLGRTILGPEENILRLIRDNLCEYIDTHYLAPSMIVAGAREIYHHELCDLADRYFGGLRTKLDEEQRRGIPMSARTLGGGSSPTARGSPLPRYSSGSRSSRWTT